MLFLKNTNKKILLCLKKLLSLTVQIGWWGGNLIKNNPRKI